jgi:hypothetical protein
MYVAFLNKTSTENYLTISQTGKWYPRDHTRTCAVAFNAIQNLHLSISSDMMRSTDDAVPVALASVSWVSTMRPGVLFVKAGHAGDVGRRWADGSPDETKDVQKAMVSCERRASVCPTTGRVSW